MDPWKNLMSAWVELMVGGRPLELLSDLTKVKFKPEAPERLIPPPNRFGTVHSYDGTSIYWELHGPEPGPGQLKPILFCYGLACSMNQWRAQLERYAEHRPCILFDYRGHHKSGMPPDNSSLNLSALAKDAAAVAHAVAPGQTVHVMGHSLGVSVALELAAAEQDLCHSLTLFCGTSENPFKRMFGTDKLEQVMSPLLSSYTVRAEIFDIVWRLAQAKPAATVLGARLLGFNMDASSLKDVETYARSVASLEPRVFFHLLRDLARGMTYGILPKIRTPTLAIAGKLDRVTPPEAMRVLAERLHNGTFIEIPAGSHNVQLDFGEYVSLKVEEFWKQRGLE